MSDAARTLCLRTLAQGSKSFAFAGRLLPAETRRDAATLYTFCRRVDDAIDDAPEGEAHRALLRLQQRVRAVYQGEPQHEVAWQAFAELVRACSLPVYAIGGMRPEHLEAAWRCGAHGIAMMRAAWEPTR